MIESPKSQFSPAIHRVFYGRTELRAGWRLCIFMSIVIVLITASNMVVSKTLHGAGNVTLFFVQETMDFLIFLAASWTMGRMEGRSIADYGLPRGGILRMQFWQGMLLGFVAITGLLVVMRMFGVFYFGSLALHGIDILKWGIGYTFVFLLVALREEFRCRAYWLFTLSTGIGFWPAAVLTSAFFGFSHINNSGENWIGLVNAGLFGLLACFLLRRTGNLWMPIGLHTAFDWGETYFYGVANSGLVMPGHLLNSSSSGAAWLSGGTVGPEGSVLCTLLLVVMFLICAAWLPEVKYPNKSVIAN